jgi:phage/plasmid-like protein (TIGR03299 family)
MSGNLYKDKKTGKTSFVAVGEPAWHKLGEYVDGAMTAEEVHNKSGQNFIVAKKPIAVAGGQKIPGYFATVRTDTNDVLGVVSDAYHVVQNHECFGFFDAIVDRGEAIYHTAGVLGRGERIFITAKLPIDIQVHGDQVENYLLLTTGHDGKKGSAIQVGFTPIRVVCGNTLAAALDGLQNKVTILHFKNAKDKLESAAKVMGMTSKYTLGLDQTFKRMAEVKISDKQLREYIEQVMKQEKKEILTKEELEKGYSKQFIKTVDEIVQFAHEHPTQQTEAAMGTVWGAYNAISGHYSFLKEYKSQEDKMKDVFSLKSGNTGGMRIEKAFDLAKAYIN